MVNALSEDQDMDVLIVPGVAFDKGLRRCGQGAGVYVRFAYTYAHLCIYTSTYRIFLHAIANVLSQSTVPRRHCLKSPACAQFYDRYISRLQSTRAGRGQREAILVGVGFAEQLVDMVPASYLDRRLDYLVLPHTVITGKQV